ncbi:TadE/TadG family type IV pilus assembly protein [Anaeromusa acidaminophila]|uniref:TadE/TadG family type IV pilus assembly protein n=1 Tax=Anaeromusa acidaminophila TaxID=81464 RepID=UPI0003742577|nr:TadE/TadG family type IV pilus assembly protein [Anaeromusa acidaminophila]
MKKHGKYCKQQGQALVETALTLLLVLVVFLGTTEFGLMLHQHQLVTHAAREGARAAAVSNDDAQVRAVVVNAAAGADPEGMTIVITPAAPRAQGSAVTVTVTIPTHVISGIIQAFNPPTEVQGTATMRVE